MNGPREILAHRLSRHFGAATAATLVVASANAAVVQSTVTNVTIPLTNAGVYVNILTGATGSSGGSVSGWDINPFGATSLRFYASLASGGGYVGGEGSSSSLVDNLPIGSVIGSASSFAVGLSSVETTGTTAVALNSDLNFVGFRFVHEGTGLTHYGFMQIRLGASQADPVRAILGIWYEDVAGASITVAAGSPTVPLPGAAGIATVAFAGLARRRRR